MNYVLAMTFFVGDVEQEPHHNVAVLQARSDGIGLLGNTSHHKKIQVVAAQQHQRLNNEDMNLHLHQKTTSDQQQQGSNLTNHHDHNIQPMVFSSSSSPSHIGTSTNKIVDVNNSQQGLQIDIPSQVKAIYLNSSGPELGKNPIQCEGGGEQGIRKTLIRNISLGLLLFLLDT